MDKAVTTPYKTGSLPQHNRRKEAKDDLHHLHHGRNKHLPATDFEDDGVEGPPLGTERSVYGDTVSVVIHTDTSHVVQRAINQSINVLVSAFLFGRPKSLGSPKCCPYAQYTTCPPKIYTVISPQK